jgi:hypothetical protein
MLKILLLLLATVVFSQSKNEEHYYYFSTAVDIRNAIVGSDPTNNKPALDVLYQAAIVGHNVEVNIGYESFNRISFDKYTVGVGYHFPLYGYIFGKEIKTVLIPSTEFSLIGRWGKDWQGVSSHFTLGGNLGLRWHLSDKIAGELLTNALPRIDLKAKYPKLHDNIPIVYSIYVKLVYKF